MEYELKLTQQELNLIYQGLGELPLKLSVNIFGKLQLTQKEQDEKNAIELQAE
jgi:hypothetical protein